MDINDFKVPLVEESSNRTIMIAGIVAAIVILIIVVYMLRREKSIDHSLDPQMTARMNYLDRLMAWDMEQQQRMAKIHANAKNETQPTEEIQPSINNEPTREISKTTDQSIVQRTSSGSEQLEGIDGDKREPKTD